MLSNKHFTPTYLRPPRAFFQVPAKKRLPTVISLKLCRNTLIRLLAVLVIISSLLVPPAYSQESEDSQIFITGFNAYQQKDYPTAITKLDEVLKKHPDSPLRDMVLFWLARAHFKNGNQLEAARYMSQFSKEYPDNPLRGTVDEELLALTARYEKGEQLPGGSLPLAAQKQDAERLAALKAEEGRKLAEKAAADKRAADQADQARRAAVQKEQERASAIKAETERKAAAKVEQERLAAVKAENERRAAEQARLIALQKEQERAAALKAEAERRAAEKAEQERTAALKAEEERKAAEKAEQQKAEAEKVDMEQVARQQAEMVRLTMAKAEQKRLAALKVEEGREAVEKAAKAEQKRIAAAKAEAEQTVAAAEEKRLADLKADADRMSAEKAERLRVEREAVEQARRAAAAAESARVIALQKEQERVSAQRIEKERQATAAAETSQRGVTPLQEQQRVAAAKAEEQRQASQRDTTEKVSASKAALREKAIAQYKSIIEKYPTSKAAGSATAKLKELGVAVALPQAATETAEPLPENAQVLRLEVAQFAGLEFNLTTKPQVYTVAQRVSIPFEITNRGNGNDSFYLESGFPAEFAAGFAATAQPEQAVNQTASLAPGESFKGLINLVIPPNGIDGLRISYPVKAASRLQSEATQSREVTLTAAAPLLRAIVKTDKLQPLPGEKAVYRVTVLNVGSTAAQGVTLRLNFPPQLEPLDFAAAGFRQEMKAALVLDGLQIKSGESREFSILFQLKDDSLAGQELLTRAELVNIPLKTTTVFVSNAAHVQQKHGVQVRTASERQVVIPGQALFIPFVVTNTGNVREKFRITPAVKGAQETVIFQDLNRDGVRQANEPIVTEVGPLAPNEEASIVIEIRTPRNSADGSPGSAGIIFSAEGDAAHSSSGSVQFVYSRPVLQLTMAARDGRLKPGEVASYDLTITNRGSNLARVVELQGTWPEQLELIAADPSSSPTGKGNMHWRFSEVGAGEKRTIKVSFRVKAGTGVGTNIQVKNLLSYEDQLGNRY
jgi:Domain of unknown function DUF11/Tetratricopeptide repeat